MSILKSPLTILGILLIIAAGVLGLGPYFVNWEAHKAEFQRQASLVTGRDVTISGPLTVRLFPWPSLTADNVRISNPPGSLLAEFAQVERVEAEISAPAIIIIIIIAMIICLCCVNLLIVKRCLIIFNNVFIVILIVVFCAVKWQ